MTRVFIHDGDADLETLYTLRLERGGYAAVRDPSAADVLVVEADAAGRRIAEAHPHTPLVVTSIYERGADPDLVAAADSFLLKPFRLDRLVSAVDSAAA
jgi:DNA-binding NarL/FixJ family response regulator